MTTFADEVCFRGSTVVPFFLPDPQKTRDECMTLYAEDVREGRVIDTDGSHRVRGLLRLPTIVSLLENSCFIQTIREVIRGPVVLGGASLNIVKPGSRGMGFHRDYPYLSLPAGCDDGNMQPLVVQVIVALDEFTDRNGATRYMPESHKLSNLRSKPTVQALLKAGDALIMHGGTWHSVDPNNTERDRASLLLNFHPYWVRPLNTPPGIAGPGVDIDSLPPSVRSLLGFDFAEMFLRDLEKVGYGVMKPKKKENE